MAVHLLIEFLGFDSPWLHWKGWFIYKVTLIQLHYFIPSGCSINAENYAQSAGKTVRVHIFSMEMLIFFLSRSAGTSLKRTSESWCVFRVRMWSPFYGRPWKSRAPFVVRLKQDAESLTHPFHNITMWQGQDVVHSLRLKIRKWHCLMQRHSCNSEQNTDVETMPGCFWWNCSA